MSNTLAFSSDGKPNNIPKLSSYNWKGCEWKESFVVNQLYQLYADKKAETFDQAIPASESFVFESSANRTLWFSDMEVMARNYFGAELLTKNLIQAVWSIEDFVFLATDSIAHPDIPTGQYIVPEMEFQSMKRDHPELINYVYSGMAFTGAQIQRIEHNEYFPTRILFLNSDSCIEIIKLKTGGDIGEIGLEYLEEIEKSDRERYYRLGTFAHEVGHHLFNWTLIPRALKEKWYELSNKGGPITKYSAEFLDNPPQFHEENFAELMRVWTLTPNYLNQLSCSNELRDFMKSLPIPNSPYMPEK